MWKRGSQSSALDRAEALLSSRRNSKGVHQSTRGSPAKTQVTVSGPVKNRHVPRDNPPLLSDLSDMSSLSSTPDHGADNNGRAGDSKEVRPESSLGGGGSRFLKKAAPPATRTSQPPASKTNMQHMPEPRYVPSSQRDSQTAALKRLAQIESRFRSRMQPQEQTRQTVPEAVSQSLEVSLPVAAQSDDDQSIKGKCFLKNKQTAAVGNTNTAASGSPKSPDGDVMSWSRTAGAAVPSVGLENKLLRPVHGVSLESDEEDMRKLLGESLDSTDNSFLRPDKVSSMTQQNKMLSKTRQKARSTPLSQAVRLSSSSSTAQPGSPPRSPSQSSSPFRFTGQAQAHFSPSALSPTPSLSGRLNSPHRTSSPQRSLSSMSGCGEVLSLEELFPVEPVHEDLHSEMSVVYSEDFKINVMTLDELVPATTGFTEETPAEESKENSPERQRELPTYKEEEKYQQQEEEEEQEDILNYQSDFESESRTEQNYSASQVSEHLPLDGDEEEAVSEVREGASDPRTRTEADYSSTFSDRSLSRSSETSDYTETAKSLNRSRDSSCSLQTPSHQTKRQAAARQGFQEAAVQTQPHSTAYTWLTGMASSGPAMGLTCSNPVAALSAETVEGISAYNPAAFVLHQMLKQQLAMTRQFIESRRHLHLSLVQSLEPPNYKYTTLEDTKEYIRKHRPRKQTMAEALEEVMQEMKEHRCTVCD